MANTEVTAKAAPPPPGRRGASVWKQRLEPFMACPGWYEVGVFHRSMVAMLNRSAEGGGSYRLPPGRWEFTGRSEGCEPGRAVIWAHYIGPAEGSA